MKNEIPRNPQAEKAFLGAVMINPGLIPQAVVRPDQFHEIGRRQIWESILILHRDGREIDSVTLQAELARLNSPVQPSEIIELIGFTPSSLNWREYETEIINADYRRRVLGFSSELAKLALSGNGIAGEVSRIVSELTLQTPKKGKGLRLLGDTMTAIVDQVQERSKNPSAVFGIPTGFIDFDAITGGWQRKQLTIFGGEAGIGKTRFVTQAATYATHPNVGFTGAIFSAEMSEDEIDLRAISTEGRLNLRNMETGFMEGEDWAAFYSAVSDLAGHNLYIDDTPNPTPDYIDSEIARMFSDGITLDFIVVDYIFLVAQAIMIEDKRLDEISASQIVTARLKRTAKTFNLAVIAISSIVKTGIGGKPKMADLRGSAQQLNDGDVVMFIYGEENHPEILHCQFVKGRHLKRRLSFEVLNDTATPRLLNVVSNTVDLNQKIGA